jgi:FixJ family two-component response regulator
MGSNILTLRFLRRRNEQLQRCCETGVHLGMPRMINGEPMTIGNSLVSIVDDDESVRESLPDLLKEFGFSTQVFSSALEFLESAQLSQTNCLVLDIAMPGMSGPELQQELKDRGENIPIIFMTAHMPEARRLNLMSRGAVACLMKPFDAAELLEALNDGLGR